jgi:hypothetical protein
MNVIISFITAPAVSSTLPRGVRHRNRDSAVSTLDAHRMAPARPLPEARHRTEPPKEVAFDTRAALYQLTAIDLTPIHGMAI